MSEYKPDWFYNIKDFYMKEERINAMPAEEIDALKSMGNKEQAKHFSGLMKDSAPGKEEYTQFSNIK
mgnify:CR=1 FL=1|jgi:hypothetical protein